MEFQEVSSDKLMVISCTNTPVHLLNMTAEYMQLPWLVGNVSAEKTEHRMPRLESQFLDSVLLSHLHPAAPLLRERLLPFEVPSSCNKTMWQTAVATVA